ncbi:ABC transporter ATP-binding protein [Thioalkalivibrio sp. HK1]|uniref:ABC transporter ATP-binding protein n=1 Tax=Thioalkalivibrio sp. HK1 TaxID=1469245 RepID=UPI00047132A8|nr:ABC transporter ATP-binding protein [Thioalkalivibrio sp. HK1]
MSRILEIDDLAVDFDTRFGRVRALDGVSVGLEAGETLGLVGESGCGKSITALAVMGLVPTPPGRIGAGSIRFCGEELIKAPKSRLRNLRGAEIAMIFQEPMSSLNPVFTVEDQIVEAIMLHRPIEYDAARREAVALLERVGIPEAAQRARDYPHQLSGGMRQRVMIAMAVSCRPRVLIADEPTTALDVTVQAQIFDLLGEIQHEFGVAIILITHDMGVISEMADRVAVMYAGRIIEEAGADDVLDHPQHPYTRGLIACIPTLEDDASLREIPGVVPPLHALGRGCAFADRCAYMDARCRRERPALAPTGHHANACLAVAEGRL